MKLYLIPLNFDEANELVRRWHRHHKPARSFRFAIGVFDEEGQPHGAAIVAQPAARLAGHPRRLAEVNRLVTDGTKNACSMLYAACARACEAMGFERVQTYILDSEPGTSLRASGWKDEGVTGGGDWSRASRGTPRSQHPLNPKRRWAKQLNPPRPEPTLIVPDKAGTASIWDEEPAA